MESRFELESLAEPQSLDAIHQLLEGSAKAIAVDTLSLDFGPSPDFAVHNTWLPAGRYGIEHIVRLY